MLVSERVSDEIMMILQQHQNSYYQRLCLSVKKKDTYPSDITDLTDIPRNWHIYNHPTTSSLPKMGLKMFEVFFLPLFYHRPIHSWS